MGRSGLMILLEDLHEPTHLYFGLNSLLFLTCFNSVSLFYAVKPRTFVRPVFLQILSGKKQQLYPVKH